MKINVTISKLYVSWYVDVVFFEYRGLCEFGQGWVEVGGIHEVRGDRIRFTGYNSRAKKMPIEFLNVGCGSHHKSVENYLSVALNSAGYKKRLPKGAIPAPSAAARAMAKAEAEWEAQQ